MIYGYLQANAFGTLVAATAIIPYIIYFLITVAYARKRAVLEQVPGQFSLGGWAKPVIGLVLFWTVLVILILALRGRLKKGTAGPAPIERVVSSRGIR